jgi:predicted ATPase
VSTKVTKIFIRGFKSIGEADLSLDDCTLLIGPNGAGKSNLLQAFRFLSLIASQSLRVSTQRFGGAAALMFRGPKITAEIEFRIEFHTESETDTGEQQTTESQYHCRLGRTGDDGLVFLEEAAASRGNDRQSFDDRRVRLGEGHRESALPASTDAVARNTLACLMRIGFFHFHDTSVDSPLRTPSKSREDDSLRSSGSNLAAYIRALSESEQPVEQAAWRRIFGLVRQVAPYIKAFHPQATNGHTRLDWVDEWDDVYGADQLSDGTLRAIALLVALGQPTSRIPTFVAIDEPELGLHPAALEVLMGLVRSLKGRCQVMLSTQSTALLDYFEPSEVIVAEWPSIAPSAKLRHPGTEFRRLDPIALGDWLAEYALSALFERNVLGGRP